MNTAFHILTAMNLFLVLMLIAFAYYNYKLVFRLRKNSEAEIWHTMAFTDDLTGLQNRAAYNKQIIKIEEESKDGQYCIILFDIDHFKEINDTKGHLAGDDVLKFVAKMLLGIFREPVYNVYRIGGDEFAVIGKNTTETQLIQALILVECESKIYDGLRLSKGYSFVCEQVETAFAIADEMLYADKLSKK